MSTSLASPLRQNPTLAFPQKSQTLEPQFSQRQEAQAQISQSRISQPQALPVSSAHSLLPHLQPRQQA
jgi:hypothetical protein